MLNIEVNPKNSLYRATKKATGLTDEQLVQEALDAGLQVLKTRAERPVSDLPKYLQEGEREERAGKLKGYKTTASLMKVLES